MNREQPKFIVTEDGILRLGRARRHCELLKAGERCIGGGYYEFDTLSNRLLLSGASSEFGEPAWDKIERLKVHPCYQGLSILYKSWDSWKEEFSVSGNIDTVYE